MFYTPDAVSEEDNQATYPYSDNPVTASLHIWAHCTYGWWRKCQDDPNGSASRELEETTRASPYHVAEHCPARSESLQRHTGRSSRPGSEVIHPLWRLMSTYGATHSWRCMPQKKRKKKGALSDAQPTVSKHWRQFLCLSVCSSVCLSVSVSVYMTWSRMSLCVLLCCC